MRSTFYSSTLITGVVALGGFSAHSWGFEPSTHRALTEAALLRRDSSLAVPSNSATSGRYLQRELLWAQGLDTTDLGKTLIEWAGQGSYDEDGSLVAGRFLNHFYDPIRDAGLSDGGTGMPSVKWAWNAPSNEYNWQAARYDFYGSMTGLTSNMRQAYLARTFEKLGHVVHMIQDLAQPQHTRNDAHPVGNRFETYCLNSFANRTQLSAAGFDDASRYPLPIFNLRSSFDERRPVSLRSISRDFFSFWDTEQFQGLDGEQYQGAPGLAEYSCRNFVTDNTMFTGDSSATFGGLTVRLSAVAPTDKHYYRFPKLSQLSSAELRNVLGAGTVTLQRSGENISTGSSLRPIHMIGPLTQPGPGYVTVGRIGPSWGLGLTDTNFGAYAADLLPRAISYSTGLYNYFFRGKIKVGFVWDKDAGYHKLDITNNSGNEVIHGGKWQLFAEDQDGFRREVSTFDASEYPGHLARYHYTWVGPDGIRYPDGFRSRFVGVPRAKRYIVVFRGGIGDEQPNATPQNLAEFGVIGKVFNVLPQRVTGVGRIPGVAFDFFAGWGQPGGGTGQTAGFTYTKELADGDRLTIEFGRGRPIPQMSIAGETATFGVGGQEAGAHLVVRTGSGRRGFNATGSAQATVVDSPSGDKIAVRFIGTYRQDGVIRNVEFNFPLTTLTEGKINIWQAIVE